MAMPDPAEQLQRIYLAGFTVEQMERFPNAVAIVKGNCIALVQTTTAGLKLIATPGWRMGDVIGVLVEKGGKQVFQNKANIIEATPERRAELDSFRRELEDLLAPVA
jgi:hypothetical protein